jgi:hypothetical protein
MLVAFAPGDGGLAYFSLVERGYQFQARWKGLSIISPEQEQAARA